MVDIVDIKMVVNNVLIKMYSFSLKVSNLLLMVVEVVINELILFHKVQIFQVYCKHQQ